jgi:hypothetical protein
MQSVIFLEWNVEEHKNIGKCCYKKKKKKRQKKKKKH